MRTVDRGYFSFRMSKISKEFFKNDRFVFTDIKTCEILKSYEDFKEVIDHYNYNGLSIEHKRNEAVDLLDFYYRTLLRDFREEYTKDENTKKI